MNGNDFKDAPMYIVEEAIDYIHARLSYLDRDDIEAVLEVEEKYMRSIGIIIEEGEVEYK